MPLEAATYINQLVATNPIHTDPLSASDSHMRLIKQVLQNTFPNLTGAVTATNADLNGGVPIGGIILWSSALAFIPANFHLCDGSNGTPDLRDRFIVGAGLSYGQGTTGGGLNTTFDGSHNHSGSLTDTQGSHSHNTSASGSADVQGTHNHGASTAAHALSISEMPSHNHFGGLTFAAVTGGGVTSTPWYNVGNSGGQQTESSQGGGAGHSHGISSDGAHGHGVSTTGVTDTTGGHAHNLSLVYDGAHFHTAQPPYVGLYYIMRTS